MDSRSVHDVFRVKDLSLAFCLQPDVVGVYSPTKENRDKFASEREIDSYDNVNKLIEDSEIIHILTPPNSHAELAVEALQQDKHVIIEKPFTGYFGDGNEAFRGLTAPKEPMLKEALASIKRMRDAEAKSKGKIFYAENIVYAPAVQKERDILEKTKDQILWMYAECSHNGSASKYYGYWSFSGGGSLMGKGVHPLTAALYLKYVEGKAVDGKPVRPVSVSSRIHAVTRSPKYRGSDFIRKDYHDIEDYGMMHVVFEDDTFCDVITSEFLLGGVKNFLEACATGHRTICNINPNTAMQTFAPSGTHFSDVYTVEKISTKEGWTNISPDENWFHGYQHEVEAFYTDAVNGTEPECGSLLAGDTIACVYAAYVSAEKKGVEVEIPSFE
ncbi:MAG: gfo/Idh/MocA family oxidoreductase [Spirochaeta sp.]|nr:gfo/Idh/MocA family oxidoreductase [Spirochaeta sp.]